MAGIIVEPLLCSGCRICELVCSLWHEDCFCPSKARIHVVINRSIDLETSGDEIDVPQVCRQCDPAPCAEACSVEAILQNPDTKIWEIDADACIGCEACAEACPFGMIVIDANAGNIAKKCELCQGSPQCIQACPRNALTIFHSNQTEKFAKAKRNQGKEDEGLNSV